VTFGRSFVSKAPAGVTVPVATFAPLSQQNSAASGAQIVAPVVGGSDPFTAEVWVSAGDGQGNPATFDGKGLTAALLPDDLPSMTFPLDVDASSTVTLAGRAWVKLALSAPAPMMQGGWFVIAVHDSDASFQVQAPAVVPSQAKGAHAPRSVPRSEAERAAVRGYHERQRKEH
jgi:hypothetical protein